MRLVPPPSRGPVFCTPLSSSVSPSVSLVVVVVVVVCPSVRSSASPSTSLNRSSWLLLCFAFPLARASERILPDFTSTYGTIRFCFQIPRPFPLRAPRAALHRADRSRDRLRDGNKLISSTSEKRENCNVIELTPLTYCAGYSTHSRVCLFIITQIHEICISSSLSRSINLEGTIFLSCLFYYCSGGHAKGCFLWVYELL